MPDRTLQQQIEDELRELLDAHGLPQPDDVAHLDRAVIFLWYDTKAFLLIDLDELPEDEGVFESLDLAALEADIRGLPLLPPPPGIPFTGCG